MSKGKVIFIFIDGVGLSDANQHNPFTNAHMPFLQNLIKGPLVIENNKIEKDLVFKGIDACLCVDGYPQSATGQTALFTGINAPKYLGYHYPAYPNEPLIELLEEYTLLKKAVKSGFHVTFANAYTPQYFELVEKGRYRHSATTLSVLAAQIPFRMLDDLRQGRAVYWDITNRRLKEDLKLDVEIINPVKAGNNLVNISNSYDLVLFETFVSDIIGHEKSYEKAEKFLYIFDSFIEGIFQYKRKTTNVIICSDHGNIEDLSTGSHTKNPVILFAAGPDAYIFHDAYNLTDISGRILEILPKSAGF